MVSTCCSDNVPRLELRMAPFGTEYRIKCTYCSEAGIWCDTERRAIESWNARPRPPARPLRDVGMTKLVRELSRRWGDWDEPGEHPRGDWPQHPNAYTLYQIIAEMVLRYPKNVMAAMGGWPKDA